MGEVIISDHAFKHGLTEEEISFAWSNFVRLQHRGAPDEGEVVVVGYTRAGRFVEMVGAERSFGTIIFHAMEPPTHSVLSELGLLATTRPRTGRSRR